MIPGIGKRGGPPRETCLLDPAILQRCNTDLVMIGGRIEAPEPAEPLTMKSGTGDATGGKQRVT